MWLSDQVFSVHAMYFESLTTLATDLIHKAQSGDIFTSNWAKKSFWPHNQQEYIE